MVLFWDFVVVFFLINLMQMFSSSWLSPSLPRAPAGAGRALSGCRSCWGQGVSSLGHLPLYLFLLSVAQYCRHVSALLPPLSSSSSSPCRAVLLQWLQGKLSLVPSWGQTHRAVSGTRTRLQLLTPHWRQVLATSPHPSMGHTEHFGSCTERPELPTSSLWPGDSGLCHSRPEQGSAGDSCSPGGRACSGCLSPLSVPGLGLEEPCSFLIPSTGLGWNLCASGERSTRQLPGKQKPCLHRTAPGLLAQSDPLGSGHSAPLGSQEDIPVQSQGSAPASGSSSCLAGLGNGRRAWKLKPQQSWGWLLLLKPLPALGVSSLGAPLGAHPPEPQNPRVPPALPPCPEAAGRSHVKCTFPEKLWV